MRFAHKKIPKCPVFSHILFRRLALSLGFARSESYLTRLKWPSRDCAKPAYLRHYLHVSGAERDAKGHRSRSHAERLSRRYAGYALQA